MAKRRVQIDIDANICVYVEARAKQLGVSRNVVWGDLVTKGLSGIEVYYCPLCRAECKPKIPSCKHFNAEKVTWQQHIITDNHG